MFINNKELHKCLTFETSNLRKVIKNIEDGGLKIALIVMSWCIIVKRQNKIKPKMIK